ncbi:transcription factor bHLH149-like [Olea europaea subsp. europaea]|uniref:Transcription factor bHLH149-like n=1 Tax=Olea europaea subsp. europaea TaxID=158383 RepID=A0A8S0QW59_OLEEU|nr:transcription factor bHLH149-like [Olea europaea subsp. europaea]
MASSSIGNPDANSNPSPKKRRKIGVETQSQIHSHEKRWKTEAAQQIYSSKLVNALCHLRRPDSATASGHAVREAADRVLANSAKGRTRWSRAILTGRLSLRLAQVNRKHKRASKPMTGNSRLKKPVVKKKQPPLQRKVRILGRLVPGCRNLSMPNLLEEATDYIAALEMQVKVMTSLLNGRGGGAGSSDRVSSDQSFNS